MNKSGSFAYSTVVYLESVSNSKMRAASKGAGTKALVEMIGESDSTLASLQHGTGNVFKRNDQVTKEAYLAMDCSNCPTMITLPAGSFDMGAPDAEGERFPHEGPQHRVKLPTFDVSSTEVTMGRFAEFVRDSGYSVKGDCYGWNGVDWGSSPKIN